MFSKKVLMTVVAIFLAVLAICNMEITQPVVEGWWNTGGFHVVDRKGIEFPDGQTTAISDYTGMSAQQKGNFFSTPNFQAMLSPRMDPQGYGTYIKYNMPDRANQAVPCDPLTFGDMPSEGYKPHIPTMPVQRSSGTQNVQTKEGYGTGGMGCASSCGVPSCGKGSVGLGHEVQGGYGLPANYANGNYNDVYNSLPGAKITQSSLPVATMTTTDSAGNTDQVVITDRLMFANIRGKGLKGSDYIRGDLAITPCNAGWFSVHPNLATEVNPGAMKVMFGNGESSDNTIGLVAQASGGSVTALSGVNMSEPQYRPAIAGSLMTGVSALGSDVKVSAFP